MHLSRYISIINSNIFLNELKLPLGGSQSNCGVGAL